MVDRHFPVRPDLEQLRHQAKDLLRGIRRGDTAALLELQTHHPRPPAANAVKLADAQLALSRSYRFSSWPRLVLSCRMTDAIWRADADAVRDLVARHPLLLHEDAGRVGGNWGPPMSYAANLGRDEIITMLHDLGARDVQHAFERACLQGRITTARALFAKGGRPVMGSVMGPCETLNPAGLALLLELGAELSDPDGDHLRPVGLLLQTYSRGPAGKHGCLAIVGEHGIRFPDTAPLAMHRGCIDLLEEHLRRDSGLLARRYSHEEIYPPELGCHADPALALHGTPLAGSTLLHLCVDYDEIEMARWLLEHGADVNARSTIDTDGFGGNTPLFGCVVSQPYRANCRDDDGFARLLLDHGADPNVRASLRKELRFTADDRLHEYRNVTPLGWGERFHDQDWVSPSVMQLLVERGGHV